MVEEAAEEEEEEEEDKPKDYLEESPFNFLLELFQKLAEWPTWQISLGGCLFSVIIFIVWLLMSESRFTATIAAIIFISYLVLDAWLLQSLPKQRISFGPWQPQLAALGAPRFIAGITAALSVLLVGNTWALIIFAATELTGSIILAYGSVIEPFRLSLTQLDLRNAESSNHNPAIRILHISDLHIERLTKREAKLIELVEQARADMILITGDYVNLSYRRDPETHAQIRWLLKRLRAPFGVYATLGSPLVDLREVIPPLFEDLHVSLMVNQWQEVRLDSDRRVVLIGLDCSHHLPTDREMLKQLVEASPNDTPKILMYHAPDLMAEAAEHEIDLYLCGHTHGGQVRLPGYGAILTSSQLGKKYEMGLYQERQTHLYVSRGVGLEGLSAPRVRFLAPPEITLVTLDGADESS